MSILSRYIFKESVTYFFITVFTFTGILLSARILKFTNLIVNKGVDFSQIVLVFVAVIPTFFEIAIPMAALLGVMMAFARLSGDSELIVMRASGVGLGRLVRPIAVFGILVSLLALYTSLTLQPWGHHLLSQTLFEIARTKSTAGLDSGVFNKLGHLTLYAETINDVNGGLTHVLLDDKRQANSRRVIVASTGVIDSDPAARTITVRLSDGAVHEIVEGNYVITDFIHNNLVVSADEIFNPDAKANDTGNRERSVTDLREYIASSKLELQELQRLRAEQALATPQATPVAITDSTQEQATTPEQVAPPPPPVEPPRSMSQLKRDIRRAQVELGRRFSLPFASFSLVLLGMALGVQPPRMQRTWGSSLAITLGLVVFIVYFALLSIGMTLAENGKWPPQLALWIPNTVVLAVGSVCVWQITREKWQSILGMAEPFLDYLAKKRELTDPGAATS